MWSSFSHIYCEFINNYKMHWCKMFINRNVCICENENYIEINIITLLTRCTDLMSDCKQKQKLFSSFLGSLAYKISKQMP